MSNTTTPLNADWIRSIMPEMVAEYTYYRHELGHVHNDAISRAISAVVEDQLTLTQLIHLRACLKIAVHDAALRAEGGAA